MSERLAAVRFPLPMATLRLADFSAGMSLAPSPAIRTAQSFDWNSFTAVSFCCGVVRHNMIS